jgi:hypothetical protein
VRELRRSLSAPQRRSASVAFGSATTRTAAFGRRKPHDGDGGDAADEPAAAAVLERAHSLGHYSAGTLGHYSSATLGAERWSAGTPTTTTAPLVITTHRVRPWSADPAPLATDTDSHGGGGRTARTAPLASSSSNPYRDQSMLRSARQVQRRSVDARCATPSPHPSLTLPSPVHFLHRQLARSAPSARRPDSTSSIRYAHAPSFLRTAARQTA